MTSLTNYQPYYEVLSRVDHVRATMRRLRVIEGFLAMVTILCGTVLVLTLAQGYLRFGTPWRAAFWVMGMGTAAVTFWKCIIVPLRWDPSDKEVARFLETRISALGNSLINTILLTEAADEWSAVLVERAIVEAAAGARGVDLMQAVSDRRAKRWAIAAFLTSLALMAFVVLGFGRFSSAALQILMPFGKVASIGDARILEVKPGTVSWIKGEAMDIEAVIADPKGKMYEGFLEMADGTGGLSRKALARSQERLDRFSFHIPQVLQPFTYSVTVGGTESQPFKVALREPPLIERIDVVYNYPEYTELKAQKVENNGGEIRCLIGTTVDMTVHVSSPIQAGNLVFGSGTAVKCLSAEGGRTMTGRFTVLKNDTYQVHLDAQAPDGAAVVYRIVALDDQPPVIQFTVPGRDTAAGLGETVKMSLKASDRYGLGEVRLKVQPEGQAEARTVSTWKKFTDPKEAILDYGLALDGTMYKLGQTVMYWAEADDRRTYQGESTPKGPNTAATAKFKIVLEDKKAAAEQRLQQLQKLYDRLREILKSQEQARATTSTLKQLKALQEVKSGGTGLEKEQKGIRDATLAVIKEVAFDADTMAVKETLNVLSANEMASAIAKAKAVGDLADASRLATVPALSKALADDQDTIIAVLRRILDIVPKLQNAVKDDQKRLGPSDLPPDALASLKALKDRLKELAADQKKVIEASKELAKKPVDDFQETDQKQLERLKALEDKWDKFLTEQISDFSKVPEVDASNPSLVKELIEVKTDVEMAADALSKKAMDVVVPLEELGMEAAKELAENLEKWLPDTPDRERWKQEEFAKDVEVPHAQLPEQMEDLVGDLLEQEEDLFEEIEDTTSGAADSADKGAGWDAMDGPISNFSAKGVTGNRLPNSSEISGRSGEGRQGKASGEFVEEEAAGKGGRRTPTRLSPDAFSKGEIKDSSKEPPGGATGGGKVSGAAGEGLEGPVPPQLQRRMGSLAGKQAQLRNKAEGVKAGLAVKNYDSFALDEAIEGMRKVQRDLLAGRYQNALRQKDVVLESLKGTKMLLGGEVRVRKDTSAALPNEIKKDVLDALEKPMPRGYEDYLKRYYERLSEGS